MKQIIPFVKDIQFDNKIALITSISLEHDLSMENNDSIVGTFNIDGKYKSNEISINEEEFNKKIDFDITLDNKYDMNQVTIDIDDFKYEIISDQILRVNIDVLVDNLVYVKEKKDEDTREIITLKEEKDYEEINATEEDKLNVIKEDIKIPTNIIDTDEDKMNKTSIFNVNDNNYVTYKVHIIRDNETINTVMDKYKVTKEELIKYNDIDNIMLGSKVIVPVCYE